MIFLEDAALIEPLICRICLCVVKKPAVTSCGHVFCTSCLLVALLAKAQCPLDRQPIDRKKIMKGEARDLVLEARLLSLRVHCSNSDLDCTWSGTLKEFDRHLETQCKYQKCSFSRHGCQARLIRSSALRQLAEPIQDKTAGGERDGGEGDGLVGEKGEKKWTEMRETALTDLERVIADTQKHVFAVQHEHAHLSMLEASVNSNTAHLNRFSQHVLVIGENVNALVGFARGTAHQVDTLMRKQAKLELHIATRGPVATTSPPSPSPLSSSLPGLRLLATIAIVGVSCAVLFRYRKRTA